MIYFQIFTTFRYKSLKNSDTYGSAVKNRPLKTNGTRLCNIASARGSL